MTDVVQNVRQLLQDFLTPELREVRSEVRETRAELRSEVKRLEDKIDGLGRRLDDKIDGLEKRVATGFESLHSALENAVLRGELSTTREIAELRLRIERLETDRRIERQ
jgi:hypothetical protein